MTSSAEPPPLAPLAEAPPTPGPRPPHAHLRAASPKPDASELYLRSRALLDSKPANTKDLDVFIKRNQESGFGFRVLGGEGPDQPVYIGAIVPLGAAEKDGRLRAGDELLCIDGVAVKGKSHKQVLELMTNAARNGQVMLTVRRKLLRTEGGGTEEEEQEEEEEAPPTASPQAPPPRPESFDVTLQRRENEGFGFVILTSKNKPPPGVIPHKIGRIIPGSPTERAAVVKVGDRISAVNGRSIMALAHNDIVQLIKDAGGAVTLTVVPEDDSAPPSGTNSAKQSPSAQHRAVGQQPPSYLDRNGDIEPRIDPAPHTQGLEEVELQRSHRGFGFSLRGGKEYNMGLFILRLAQDGEALRDGRVHVGDQIVAINGELTQGITHTRAIELIQAGGSKVHLLLRPGQGLVPDHSDRGATVPPPPLSTSEPSSPKMSDQLSGSDPRAPAPPPPGAGPDQGRPADRSRGQHPPPHTQQRGGRSDSKSSSPKRTGAGRAERRSLSPRKGERGEQGGGAGSLEDLSRDDRPRRGPGTDGAEPQSPRRPAGQQPGADGKDRRHRDQDPVRAQDRSRGTAERHKKGRTERDAHGERTGSEGGTLTRGRDQADRNRHQGPGDPGGSGSQEPGGNGSGSLKKAAVITPGPWKVPSSARIQSQTDGAFAQV